MIVIIKDGIGFYPPPYLWEDFFYCSLKHVEAKISSFPAPPLHMPMPGWLPLSSQKRNQSSTQFLRAEEQALARSSGSHCCPEHGSASPPSTAGTLASCTCSCVGGKITLSIYLTEYIIRR